MDCCLRPALESDRGFLYSLHCVTMRDAIEKTWGWDEVWQRDDFEERFKHCSVSIIQADGRDVGGLWLESQADLLYIVEFQVLPECQGRGIGTSVLNDLIGQATRRGIPLELSVLPINPRAQRLYERLGFKVTDEGDPFIRMRHDGVIGPASA